MTPEPNQSTNGLATDLATLPTSLRERLEHFNELVRQGREQEAVVEYATVELELAKLRPDLLILLRGQDRGFHGFVATDSEVTHTLELFERKLFGFVLWNAWRPVSTTKTNSRTVKLF